MKQSIKGFIGDSADDSTEKFNGKISATIGDFKPSSRVRTPKGLLCKDAVLAIAPQVREYHPSELKITNWPTSVIRLYTPPEVLFAPELMDNINEVSDNHPANNQVTPDNWKKFVIGSVSNGHRVGDEFRGDILIKDATAIENIEKKRKTELSIGYGFNAEFVEGVTDNGEPYDAIITSMVGDHVALVKVGRGGKRVRIGDSKQEIEPVKVKIRLSNGQVWEVDVEGNGEAFKQSFDADQEALADAVEKLNTEIQVGESKFKVSEAPAIQAVFTALDNQLKEATTKAEDLEKSMIKPEEVEEMAEKRAKTIEEAKNLKPDLDPAGKSLDDIISEAVTVHGEEPSVKAVLEGVAIGDAQPDRMKIAFNVLSASKPKKDNKGKITGTTGDSATAEALAALNNQKQNTATDAKTIVAQSKSEAWKREQK